VDNCLDIVYDYSPNLQLHSSTVLQTAYSQLHSSAVLQTRSSQSSLPTVLWKLLPWVELVVLLEGPMLL